MALIRAQALLQGNNIQLSPGQFVLMQFSVIFFGGVKFRMRTDRNIAFLFYDDRTKYMAYLSFESTILIEKNAQTRMLEVQKYLFCLVQEVIFISVR